MIEASDQSQTEKRMDDEEIVANILNFFITNYDALAIHLCYTIYLLALNSDIQEKLQLEIDKYFINKNVIRDMHDNNVTNIGWTSIAVIKLPLTHAGYSTL